jgi:SWIM zinc finger
MPDLTIEYYHVCPSTQHFHKQIKEYSVTYGFQPTGDYQYGWSCTCPHFRFRKTECKHIQAAKEERCAWNEDAYWGSGAPKPADGKCPNCGETLTVIKVAV